MCSNKKKLFYTIFTIVTIVGTFYGFGKHSKELSPENLMLALRVSYPFSNLSIT